MRMRFLSYMRAIGRVIIRRNLKLTLRSVASWRFGHGQGMPKRTSRSGGIDAWLNRSITLINHPDIKNGRVDSLVAQDALRDDVDLKNKKNELDSKLRENLANQKKLYDSYEANLIAIEIFKDKSIDLRNDEQNLRKEITKIEVRLIEKERSADYQKILNRILENFDKTKEELDPITRKELLQLVIKSILLKDKKIVKLELYQPFKRYLEELKCSTTPVITKSYENSYILKPTAAK